MARIDLKKDGCMKLFFRQKRVFGRVVKATINILIKRRTGLLGQAPHSLLKING